MRKPSSWPINTYGRPIWKTKYFCLVLWIRSLYLRKIYRPKTLNLFSPCSSSKVQCTAHFSIADGPALSVLQFIPGPGGRLSLAISYISAFVLRENMILTYAKDSCERTSHDLLGRRNRKESLKYNNLTYSQICLNLRVDGCQFCYITKLGKKKTLNSLQQISWSSMWHVLTTVVLNNFLQ